MKKIRLCSSSTVVVALILSSLIVTSQAFAQPAGSTKRMTSSPIAMQSRSGQGELKSTEKEREQLRAELFSFVQANKLFAGALGMNRQVDAFEKYEQQIQQLSSTQLDGLRNGLLDTSGMNAATQKLRDQVQMHSLPNIESSPFKMNAPIGLQLKSAGFPVADYPSCGSTRISDAIVDASDVSVFAAEIVRETASRACDEVVVILGEGGNGSLACIITDGIYIAAKIVNYALHFCNDKIDQAELGATYSRLDHIHIDLGIAQTAILASIGANTTMIINNSNANTSTIVNNENANRDMIISELKALGCEIIRLLNTPDGKRASSILACSAQPGFPYSWNKH